MGNGVICYTCELDPAWRKGLCQSCYFYYRRNGAVRGKHREPRPVKRKVKTG